MRNAIVAALVLGVFVVLTSFAIRSPVSAKVPSPLTASQFTLDRAFRDTVQVNPFNPVSVPFPPTQGMIVTQLVLSGGNLTVTVNGVLETFILTGSQQILQLNPPIIVKPGQVFGLTAGNTIATATFCGYTTLPGET